MNLPKIRIENSNEPMTAKEMKILFAGQIINGLVTRHNDLGGRDNDRLAVEAWKLAEVMVSIYFKE